MISPRIFPGNGNLSVEQVSFNESISKLGEKAKVASHMMSQVTVNFTRWRQQYSFSLLFSILTSTVTDYLERDVSIAHIINRIFKRRISALSLTTWKKRHSFSLLFSIITSATTECLKYMSDSIAYAIHRIFRQTLYSDKYKLITHCEKIEASQNAWFINLALLRQAIETSEVSAEQNKQIQFLASNYLHKGAPIHIKIMRIFFRKLESQFQVNGLTSSQDHYHRFSLHRQIKLGAHVNRKLALGNESPLILTDTTEFEHLLPLKFHVMQEEHPNSHSLLSGLAEHFSTHPIKNALKGHLSFPFLFDLTSSLGKNIETGGDKQRELAFKGQLNTFKAELDIAIIKTVDTLIVQKPNLAKYRCKLIKFVKKNTTCICRTEVENIAGIKVLPLYSKIKGERVLKVHQALSDFVISTGIGIGAVNLRREMLNSLNYRTDVRYAVKPKDTSHLSTRFYSKIEDFTNCSFYQRFASTFGSPLPKTSTKTVNLGISQTHLQTRQADLANKPHLMLLGKATMDLLTGILSKVKETQWQELQENPIYCQIMQASLYKIREFLATAELHMDDFAQFAQQIELVHSELATILEIIRPYQESDFEDIYKNVLQSTLPKNLHPYLKVSLGKTSVNICTGINEAVRQMTPHPHCVYSQGFYFEQAAFVGYQNQFERMMASESSRKVDLYFGQFNPNIEIASDFVSYERRDIAKDIHALIDSGKAADHLTVAIDCTIDTYNSENVHHLLQQFEKEIEEGNLNFIFFRSGQKFDMLGMDGYYGSPLYIINNNSKKWQSFNSIPKRKIHQTDILSNQWFCLSNQYASDSLALYRKLIFDNTRYILDHIPEKLKPVNSTDLVPRIRVNMAAKEMDACFIDIKVLGTNHKIRCLELLGKFYEKMMSKGIKLQTRATFGLYHPNALIISVNEVEDSSSIRLHPGLNPEENAAFIEYFQELAE